MPVDDPPRRDALDSAPDPLIGELLAGRYRLLRRLGEGGMGVVYLAEHVELKKQVAVKVLTDRLAHSAGLVEHLEREARTAARIRHENIVDITDLGRTTSGLVFVVMEYLEGRSLFDAIYDGGPMPVDRVRRIANQLFSAVEAAHDHDVIHRDLKPENVFLVVRDQAPDFVKLLDFGVATVRARDEKRLSIDGRSAGTPLYMSPEHLRGEPPDRSFDVFALACILYEMLTGMVPFDGESAGAILTRQLAGPPVAPSELPGVDPLPPGLDAVLLRALSLNRTDRFPSVRALREAFERALDGKPVPAPPAAPSPSAVAPRRWQTTAAVEQPLPWRRRSMVVLAGAFTFAAALVFTWAVVKWRARLALDREIANIEAQIVAGGDALDGQDGALARWRAAMAHAPGRADLVALAPRIAAGFCARGARELAERHYTEALAEFERADGIEAGLRCDEGARQAALRGRFASGAGMVAAGGFYIDRYEYPNERRRRPLTGVDWAAAAALCEKAGKRLCTEAEWEAACGGAAQSAYPYGPEHRDACLDEHPRERGPHPAGDRAACTSPVGAVDMSGNVAEWTASPLHPGAPQRVVRGGWWGADRTQTTCQARDYLLPGAGGSRTVGFRCCY